MDALEKYTEHLNKVQALLTQLRGQIGDHAREFYLEGGKNWGCVSDLLHVEEVLQEAAEFIDQVTEA